MNKASMIHEICCGINIKYLPSMYRMSYKEVEELYEALFKIGIDLQEIKKIINSKTQANPKKNLSYNKGYEVNQK